MGTGKKGHLFQGNKGKMLRERGNKDNIVSMFPSSPRDTREQVPPGSVLAQKANLVSFMRTAKALANLHI